MTKTQSDSNVVIDLVQMVSSLCNIFAMPTKELCSSTSRGIHLNCQHSQTDLLITLQMALGLWIFHSDAPPRRVVIHPAERGFTPNDVEIIPATIAALGAPAEVPGKPPGSVPLLALEDGNMMSTNRSPSLSTSKTSPGPEACPPCDIAHRKSEHESEKCWGWQSK